MGAPARVEDLAARLRGPDPRLAAAAVAREVVPGRIEAGDLVVAFALASFDLKRALTTASLPFRRVARDRMLQGSVAAVRYGSVQLLLEQPDGEGGLSAYLSHYGEGVAAVYLERPRFLPPSRASGRPPRAVHTPFGRRGWLLAHEWPWGPFIIALESEG
jgi:hypothetical protein